MPDVDKTNCELTDELAALRQRVAELEQSEMQYQRRQAALEKQITELKAKLASTDENLHSQVAGCDIERQQVKVALQESSEQLRLALNAAHMGLWDWNIVTNKVIWSENHELLYGLVPGSFPGNYEAFLSYIHPEDRQSVIQVLTHALEEKTDYSDEFRIVWPDQSVYWIFAKGQFFYDDQGQAVRMIGVCMDITDRKQAKESTRQLTTKVQEQANILNAILAASVDNIFIINRTGCYQYVSHGGAAVLGFKVEDIIGKNVRELDLPADFIDRVENQRQVVMTTGEPIKDECEYVLADGRHYYEYILTPLGNFDQIEGVITVSRDITEHKRVEQSLRESEARFRRLFESNLVGVAFWNMDGFITDANDAYLQLAGYTRDEFAALGKINWRATYSD